jgi:hypothetical protein
MSLKTSEASQKRPTMSGMSHRALEISRRRQGTRKYNPSGVETKKTVEVRRRGLRHPPGAAKARPKETKLPKQLHKQS